MENKEEDSERYEEYNERKQLFLCKEKTTENIDDNSKS